MEVRTYHGLAGLLRGVVVIRGAVVALVVPQHGARLQVVDDVQVASPRQVIGKGGVTQVAAPVLLQYCKISCVCVVWAGG